MLPVPGNRPGRLTDVHGLVEARLVSGIVDIALTISVGEQVVPLPEGNRYLGFIFAQADTPDAVERVLRKAYTFMQFKIAEIDA